MKRIAILGALLLLPTAALGHGNPNGHNNGGHGGAGGAGGNATAVGIGGGANSTSGSTAGATSKSGGNDTYLLSWATSITDKCSQFTNAGALIAGVSQGGMERICKLQYAAEADRRGLAAALATLEAAETYRERAYAEYLVTHYRNHLREDFNAVREAAYTPTVVTGLCKVFRVIPFVGFYAYPNSC